MRIYISGDRASEMMPQFFINTTNILKDIIIAPNKLFNALRSNRYVKEIHFLFALSAVITFSKTFLLKRQTVTFFPNDSINRALSLLNIPQVRWIILYLGYFIFVFGVFWICKFFNRKANLRILVLSLMSISGLGVVLQILLYSVSSVFAEGFLDIVSYLSYFWVILLSLFAIKISQAISLWKATVCFFVPALPFIILVLLLSMAPYLAWLGVH